jgi:hypothetical protein
MALAKWETARGGRRTLRVRDTREILRLRVPAGNRKTRFPEENRRDATLRMTTGEESHPLESKGGAPAKALKSPGPLTKTVSAPWATKGPKANGESEKQKAEPSAFWRSTTPFSAGADSLVMTPRRGGAAKPEARC